MNENYYADSIDSIPNQKYLTDSEKEQGRTLLNFIDWFAPNKEINAVLQDKLIALIIRLAYYEKENQVQVLSETKQK